MISTEPVILLLGSNIGPERYLLRACKELSRHLRIVAASRVYASEAAGSDQQPEFENAALQVVTDLGPLLLKYGVLRRVEADLGRVRGDDRYAPRTIDIDVVFYGDRVFDLPATGLTVPDPESLTHGHVIRPVMDLVPGHRHPRAGVTMADVASAARESLMAVRPAPDPDRLRRWLDRSRQP